MDPGPLNDEEIRPLIASSPSTAANSIVEVTTDTLPPQRLKMSIFSVSYGTGRSKERRNKPLEADFTALSEFLIWAWGGSRYSGMVCMALSSLMYSIMGLFVELFAATSAPSYEIVFIRCAVILVAAFIWLRKTGQPLFGLPHVWRLLMARAVTGYLSLLGFFYSIQVLPLHDAIVLNFATPFMAAILASFILQEKLGVIELGGIFCNFLGIFLVYQPVPFLQGQRPGSNGSTGLIIPGGRYYIHTILIALLSAVIGGANYCFIRAAAKASEQPLVTVFAFAAVACPAAAICTLLFQAIASHILGIMFLGKSPSIGGLFGSAIIVISTMAVSYFGNDKPPES